jgi:uncharacterized protein with FMN-binding domain
MTRRGGLAIAFTAIALILLVNFKTPYAPTLSRTGLGAAGGATDPPAIAGVGPSARPPATPHSPSGSQAPSTASANGTITGPVIDTRYGPVQLEATVSNGKFVDVRVLQLPTDRALSARISLFVAPILRSEALQVQSAQIDYISGATYTSEGYAESLQAILDKSRG